MKNVLKLIIDAFKIAINKNKSDWNQDDESQPNYIKNRPFYGKIEEITLLENYTSDEYDNEDISKPALNFIPGHTYKVIWNGEVYDNLICKFDGDDNVIASNEYGCPFYIDDDGGNSLYIESDEDEQYAVSIIEYKNTLKTIDEMYISNNIPKVSTSSVGQILEVEKIDENGVPTKWKTTDRCITSYKYLDRLQETDTHVLFCVDLDNPKYLTYIMPNKYATIHIYKDGVKVAGANTGVIYHTLRLIECNDSRVYLVADNGIGTLTGYFYYFNTGWSKKFYTTTLDALEYEFLHLENEREYIPTGDYNPATKKYVDDLGNTKISSPTTGEIGQVLVVEEIDENGHPVKWKTVDNSNNKPFIVTVTQTDAGFASDKTYAEILEAYNKGQTIYAVKDDCIYYLNAVINNSFRFREYTVTNGSITSGQIMINQFMVMYATSDFTKDKVGNTYNYENLNTEDKTLVGAINEIDAKFDAFVNAEEVAY